MSKKSYQKYIKFIGDMDFLKEFVPDIKEEEETSDQVESYMFASSPKYIDVTLRDYQIEGLNWLVKMHENKINCILADEMGLGKTLQSISLLGYIKHIKEERAKHLIVVPKSCLQNWLNEFKKFIPSLKVKMFWCPKTEIRSEYKLIAYKKYDVILTTYEMCINAKSYLKRIDFSYLVIDEAHRLKNEESLLSQILRMCNFKHRLLLTGTPLQNNIHELWALLNFILPEIFSNSERFENFVTNAGQGENSEKIEKLKEVLQMFFLRREKADVEKSLLPKKFTNIYAPMVPLQKDWYKGLLKRDVQDLYTDKTLKKTQLLNVIMQLRKCCNHPYLFDGVEKEPYEAGEHLVENSGKLIILDKLLANLFKNGSRVLIFSQMSRMLDILEDYVNLRGYNYCRIDGSTSGDDRTEAIDSFNTENSDKFLFLLTTRAGGLGINLYTADTVVIFDSDWNPYADLQAQDRAHRIGQKKQVHVFRLLTENTIEESVVLRAQQKLKLDDVLMRSSEKIKQNVISNSELMQILASGIDTFDKESGTDKLSIEEILRVGEEKTAEMNKKIENYKIGDTELAKTNMYQFEGENYLKKKLHDFAVENSDISEEPPKRMSFFTNLKFKSLKFPEYQFYPLEFYSLQEKEELLFNKGEPLSEEDKQLKEKLLSEGFDWTKKDYKLFISALENYGENVEAISKMMPNKSDVERYYKVFMQRYHELSDADKITLMLERVQQKIEKNNKLKIYFEKITDKELENVLLSKNRFYTDNVHLLRLYCKYIDDPFCYEKVKLDFLQDNVYDFEYFMHSRSTSELSKHISVLTAQVIKYFEKF